MQIVGIGVPLYQGSIDILVATFISTMGSKSKKKGQYYQDIKTENKRKD